MVFEDEPLANTVPPGASIAFGEVLPETMRLAREKTALDRSAVCKRELVLVSQGPPSKNPRPLARLRGDVTQRAWIARSCPAR